MDSLTLYHRPGVGHTSGLPVTFIIIILPKCFLQPNSHFQSFFCNILLFLYSPLFSSVIPYFIDHHEEVRDIIIQASAGLLEQSGIACNTSRVPSGAGRHQFGPW